MRCWACAERMPASHAVKKMLEETRAHYDNIFGLEEVIRAGLELPTFPVDHTLDYHTLGSSKFAKAASECYGLLDGGIVLQTIPTRALDLACEEEEGRYRHIEHITILQSNTLRHPASHQLFERHPYSGLPVCSSRDCGSFRWQSLFICRVGQNDLKTGFRSRSSC